jgi:hypothetical protein
MKKKFTLKTHIIPTFYQFVFLANWLKLATKKIAICLIIGEFPFIGGCSILGDLLDCPPRNFDPLPPP